MPRPQRKAVKLTTEHAEQALLFQWAEAAKAQIPELELLHAIPNFAKVSPRWGAWMKAEGKKAGVPDVHLPVARGEYASLYIEMKVPPNKETPAQIVWRERLNAAGNMAVVCRSFDEARGLIVGYLTLRAAGAPRRKEA